MGQIKYSNEVKKVVVIWKLTLNGILKKECRKKNNMYLDDSDRMYNKVINRDRMGYKMNMDGVT